MDAFKAMKGFCYTFASCDASCSAGFLFFDNRSLIHITNDSMIAPNTTSGISRYRAARNSPQTDFTVSYPSIFVAAHAHDSVVM
jgi:hypothetical protein